MRERMVALAAERRRFGHRRVHRLLDREGHRVNHQRVYRLYTQAGLMVRRRGRRLHRGRAPAIGSVGAADPHPYHSNAGQIEASSVSL